jgi:hypothetical protein
MRGEQVVARVRLERSPRQAPTSSRFQDYLNIRQHLDPISYVMMMAAKKRVVCLVGRCLYL